MKSNLLVAGFILMIFISCNNSSDNKVQDESAPTIEVNTSENTAASMNALPSFTVLDEKGEKLQLQDLKGKRIFVNLWASWCPPCKREMPSIEKLYASADTSKVKFVMLSLDDNFDKAKSYINTSKLKLPIYYPTENLPSLFNVQGIPATFIFNENGELVKRVDGMDDYDTEAYRALLR